MKAMRKGLGLFWAFTLALTLASCGSQTASPEEQVAGKVYTYEGEGFGSSFSITVSEDGSFTYYEGGLSSYIGSGRWSVEDDVLTLTDDTGVPIVNHFRIDGDDLIFAEADSSNFLYVDVKDGEVFRGAPLAQDEGAPAPSYSPA